MKVLFVCTGNTCRSVLAEQLLRRLADERGLGWEVKSCGLAANPAGSVPDHVRALVREMGVEDFHHQARPVSPGLVGWADLILAMTDTQMRELWNLYPEAKGKTFLLREHAGLAPEDIDDPIGGPREVYDKALSEIREGLLRIVGKDGGGEPPGRG